MQKIPPELTDSWPVAFRKPPFRVFPVPAENRQKLRAVTERFADLQHVPVLQLKRLLWHPEQFDTEYSAYIATSSGESVRVKCVDEYAALVSWTQNQAEIYDKVSGRSIVYESHADFLADGWVLD